MATYQPAKRATAWVGYISLVDQSDTKKMKSNPTIASGDFKVSKDGGALANLTTLPSVTPASSVMVKIDLSATEMTADNVTVVCIDAAGAEWCDLVFNLQPSARQIDDLAYPATSGRSMVVDAAGLVDANTVKVGPSGSGTAQTAGDIPAMVTTVDDFLDTEIAAIKAKTDNLPTDPADASDVAAAFATVNATLGTPAGASVSADIAAVKVDTAAILVDTGTTLDTKIDTIASYIDTEVSAILAAVDTEIGAIKAVTDQMAFGTANRLNVQVYGVETDAIGAADVSAAAANKIADHILRRALATALASSDGDTKTFRSLAGAVAKLVDRIVSSGGTLTIYEPDDSTSLGTQTLTTDAGAEPIIEANTV